MQVRRLKKGIHTFVICAFKSSEYLEECIISLKKQTLKSEIIVVTSTPNSLISNLADKYSIPLYINDGQGGIAQDWNFGISKCNTRFITIAHQDDIYSENYLNEIFKRLIHRKAPLIAFSDYGEIRDGKTTESTPLLNIKRLMLLPLRIKSWQQSKFIKQRILSLGNPICCPSVTLCMDNLSKPVFAEQYGSNLDWQAWGMLAKQSGDFVYVNKVLMYHRIHEKSTTNKLINSNDRGKEDRNMLEQFWPKPIAVLISKLYRVSERLN